MTQIIQVATVLGGTKKSGVYEDLGVEMAPYPTLCTYLNILLLLIPGGYGIEGGMHLTTGLVSAAGSTAARPADIDEDGYEHGYRVTPVTVIVAHRHRFRRLANKIKKNESARKSKG